MANNRGIDKVAAGLIILAQQRNAQVWADHDVIYAGGAGRVSDDDYAALTKLGWVPNDDVDHGWQIFV